MTPQELSRQVPHSARRRDRAVLCAFGLSWLAALALALACYVLVRSNSELEQDVRKLEVEVSLAHTLVVIERAKGHERQLRTIAELSERSQPTQVAAAEPAAVPATRPTPTRGRTGANRGRARSRDRVEVDCQDSDGPLCGLGTTESLR